MSQVRYYLIKMIAGSEIRIKKFNFITALRSSSGYRIAIKICKDCVLENNEGVEKFNNYTKTSKQVVKF